MVINYWLLCCILSVLWSMFACIKVAIVLAISSLVDRQIFVLEIKSLNKVWLSEVLSPLRHNFNTSKKFPLVWQHARNIQRLTESTTPKQPRFRINFT